MTDCADEMDAGAVYTPFETVPTWGERVQLMPVLVVPETTAFMAVDCPTDNEVVVGLSLTEIVGIRAIVAVAVFVVSTTLVAFNVMLC